jgi:tRNA uridine 5-carbamoylmethylation protein Kti12
MLDDGKYSKGNEKHVVQMRDVMIEHALLAGKHVIVDDTNLHPAHETNIRELVKTHNAAHGDNVRVEVKEFDVGADECIERDKKRANSVGAEVILKMAKQYSGGKSHGREFVPELDMPTLVSNGLPWCVLYDLDGTAAIMGDRSPYDASKCDEVDRPNIALKVVLSCMEQQNEEPDTPNLTFIAFSGRDGQYREPTATFIAKHEFPCDQLHMRESGDHRKDSIIKREMYEKHIKGKYNVLVVFDDRNQVVDMWRKELNLPCFQVNYGDF